MGNITFVIGGARSGKSTYALGLGTKMPGRKGFVATAEVLDEEMKERIYLHQKTRPLEWETIEEPIALSERLQKIDGSYDVVIVDCLTLWLSNMLEKGEDIEPIITAEVENICKTLRMVSYKIIIVSNEVGQGIIPENKLARLFRDVSGRMNHQLASTADEVYLVTCGIPLRIK